MAEAQFLAAVRQLAQLCGWRVYHTHDSRRSEPGFPDLAMVHPGQKRIVFAELKTATGRTTAEQDAWLVDLDAAGAEAYLWRPADLQTFIPAVLSGCHSAEDHNAFARTNTKTPARDTGARDLAFARTNAETTTRARRKERQP